VLKHTTNLLKSAIQGRQDIIAMTISNYTEKSKTCTRSSNSQISTISN